MTLERNYSKEFEMIAKAYEKSGGNVSKLLDRKIASIIISGDKIIGMNTIDGVEIHSKEIENGVEVDFKVLKGVKVPTPIHICTGYTKKEGTQNVVFNITIEDGGDVNFISHCSFPWSTQFRHVAKSNVYVGKNARMTYLDEHFHSENGNIGLESVTNAVIDDGGYYYNSFTLTKTRVGKLKLDMDMQLKKKAVGELISTIKGKKDDFIDIKETVRLDGEHSHGIAKTVVVATDESKAYVKTEAYGNAPESKGHIECNEVTKGDSVDVYTIPLLKVTNDTSELTHEASIGRVNQFELETLMAKGLSEDDATDMIIKGLIS
jgi:Fe-S cluster assembly scaffold protein SufB